MAHNQNLQHYIWVDRPCGYFTVQICSQARETKSRERGQRAADKTEVSNRTMGHLTQKKKKIYCLTKRMGQRITFAVWCAAASVCL